MSYSYLTQALALPSHAALESLVQTALYSSLVEGHLDPLNQRLAINSVAPLRDLPPNSVQRQLTVLADWEARCGSVLDEIQNNIANITSESKLKSDAKKRRQRLFEDEIAAADRKKGEALVSASDPMDLDDNGSKGPGRGLKRPLNFVPR